MATRRTLVKAGLAGALTPFLPVGAMAEDIKSTLGAIRIVTITADDVAAAQDAWVKVMGYKLVHMGVVSKADAAAWSAPALAGKAVAVVGPASGEPTYLRFVQQATPAGYETRGTYGWNTTEITVQESDALYEKLKGSAFTPEGPPRTVPTYEYLHALQAARVPNERLNLTWITQTRPDLAVAKSFVGRVFITVMGAPDLPAALAFYKDTFGNEPSPIRDLPNFKLAVVKLDDGCKIEIDQHPHAQAVRQRPAGGLPYGVAMVSFECSDFDRQKTRLTGPAATVGFGTFKGRRSGVMAGAAGELIELIAI